MFAYKFFVISWFTNSNYVQYVVSFEFSDISFNVLRTWCIKRIVTSVTEDGGKVGIHCMSGLGRAPLLVAIFLIEDGMEASDAIQLIESKRHGALSNIQRRWLYNYKKTCVIS